MTFEVGGREWPVPYYVEWDERVNESFTLWVRCRCGQETLQLFDGAPDVTCGQCGRGYHAKIDVHWITPEAARRTPPRAVEGA